MPIAITDRASASSAALPTGLTEASARRQRLNPRAGRALEILGHAIEYLADGYAHDGSSTPAKGGMRDAIQILMSVNREIYLSCPKIPSLRERLQRLVQSKCNSADLLRRNLLADSENGE